MKGDEIDWKELEMLGHENANRPLEGNSDTGEPLQDGKRNYKKPDLLRHSRCYIQSYHLI